MLYSIYRHKNDVSACLASRCEFDYREIQNDPHHTECFRNHIKLFPNMLQTRVVELKMIFKMNINNNKAFIKHL